jgi:SAM-dependent methyltransferase
MSTNIKLTPFWPNAKNIEIPIQPGLNFIPDDWGEGFSQGMRTLDDWDGQTICELGSGTGINVAGLATAYNNVKVIACDLVPQAVEATQALIETHNLSATVRQSDILDSFQPDEIKEISRFVGCIPQVLAEEGVNLFEGDNASHLCERSGTKWDDYCLPLQAKALSQIREHGKDNSSVILNLAVRPPLDVLHNLFNEHGRKMEILHSRIVPQHLGTCLQPFADQEKDGKIQSTFYADPEGKQVISGTEARRRQRELLDSGADKQSAAPNIFHGLIVAYSPRLVK